MTTQKEHTYAHVLRWIADGVPLSRIEYLFSTEWHALSSISPEWIKNLVFNNWASDYEFRIANEQIKIGDRWVEAPIREVGPGGLLWAVDSHGCGMEALNLGGTIGRYLLSTGRAFRTKEAAIAAHEAITELLTKGERK